MQMLKFSHPYHLVNNSPWPFFLSFFLIDLIISLLLIIYNKINYHILIQWSIISILICVFCWVKEIINESIYKGEHTKKVTNNLFIGFILFLISEVLIFGSLFFAYFFYSLIPSIEIGGIWPPIGIFILNPFSIPLYNTIILYLSGISITISQNYIYNRYKYNSLYFVIITIILGLDFTFIQYLEYNLALFNINDSIYGTIFYILTGFHGVHVIIGSILLIISLIRLYNNHFTNNSNLGFNISVIYWHFVDYIWLILYTFIYSWGC